MEQRVIEHFISCFRVMPKTLPGIIKNWDNLDYDLRLIYLDDIEVYFSKIQEIIEHKLVDSTTIAQLLKLKEEISAIPGLNELRGL